MKTIAVIDDDIHISNVLEELLRREGYAVLRAYSGTEAVLLLERQRPDLVLLDLMLPGLPGEEVLSKIAGVPVMVVSAKAGVENRVDLLLKGAVDYLEKPFDSRELLTRVLDAMGLEYKVLTEGRADIFAQPVISQLSAAVFTAFLFCGACILFTLAVGVPLLGGPKYPGLLLKTTLLSLLMAAAWCALYIAVILNCSRKSASAVSCMLLYLLLFMVATWVFAKLDAPEFWPSYELIDGEMVSEMVRNPTYLQPGARRIYEFWLDLNPIGQSIQYIDVSPARPLQLALCSLGVFAVATAAGATLFQRKDLK